MLMEGNEDAVKPYEGIESVHTRSLYKFEKCFMNNFNAYLVMDYFIQPHLM